MPEMTMSKEYHDLAQSIAVFQATTHEKLDSINEHLARLNTKTSKNEGAITQLQEQDRDLYNMVASQKKQDQLYYEREEAREEREHSMRARWKDLLFNVLQWIVPAILIGILLNGEAIAKFLGFT